MRRSLTALVLAAVLLPCARAQPSVPGNFTVSVHAFGIAASGEAMAADARGFLYVLDRTTLVGADTITLVRPDGVVVPGFVQGIGTMSQIAYDPTDGACYVLAHSPILPVVNSTVYRLDPTSGATQVGNVAVIAEGFTIDDTGRRYFGTQTGLSGPGLYSAPPGGSLVFHGPGFGRNAVLQALHRTGDVLIGDVNEVRRFTPMAILPLAYWSQPLIPNTIPRVTSIARNPFNQYGAGSVIGYNDFTTLCMCGIGSGFPGDLTTGSLAPFATEAFNAPQRGLRTVASGVDQELYWLTDVGPSPAVGKNLYRVTQDVTQSQGHLIVSVTPAPMGGSNVQLDVYGRPAGGEPFLLGTIPGPPPAPRIFVPPFGRIMDIFHASYVPLLDGVGVFLPPNPLAVTPPGGHFRLILTAPPAGGLPFDLQALVLSPGAQNGFFFISNVESVTLP